MPTVTYRDLMQQLKAGKYSPLYLLHGEESYFIDKVCRYIEQHALSEQDRSFNQVVLYGKDTDCQTVIDNCNRYPVMAQRQLVVLKEAQAMRGLDDLVRYAERPLDSTILVVCHKYGTYDKRKKLLKTADDKGVVMEAKPLYDNQVPAWIEEQLRTEYQLSITPEAAQLMADHIGTDLQRVSHEIEKLGINMRSGDTVQPESVQRFIGISKEYSVFELQSALARRDALKTFKIVYFFADNPREYPLPKIIPSLYNFFSKVYICHGLPSNTSEQELMQVLGVRVPKFAREYLQAKGRYTRRQTERAIGLLREYDLKSKGVDADNAHAGDLLCELALRLLA